jgi:NAD(P)H dehydrogenase (quinone)
VKTLIVYAHPEPTSFNGRLLDTAVRTLSAGGHEVQVSDLYAMRWNPVASADDFAVRRFPETLQYDREQKNAVAERVFSPDIAAEIAKVVWCDLLVLQFPLWWYGTPAIMKGWFDRVFVNGLMYGAFGRFDKGGMTGRRALVSTTTGSFPGMVGEAGVMGHLDAILWHLEYGTLAYAGFSVLQRYVANAVRYIDGPTREGYLAEFAEHLRRIDTLPVQPAHTVDEFGEDFRLRPEIAPRTLGHGWRGAPV